MILESTLLCCRCITCTEISSGWDFPNGKTTLEQNKLCLKLHLIGYKSKKSPPSLCGCIFLDEKPHAAGILRWFYARELQRRQCSLRICFLEAFGEIQSFFPKELTWPWAIFYMIWDIFHPPIDVVRAIWEVRACSLPVFCAFFLFVYISRELSWWECWKGKFVSGSKILRGIWEWSAITQTETRGMWSSSSNGGEESQEVYFPSTTFMFLWQRRKVQCSYHLAYKHCMHFLDICFVYAICKPGYYF